MNAIFELDEAEVRAREVDAFRKNFRDLTGQRFDRLLALYPVGRDSRRQTVWLMRCDCGKEIAILGRSVTSGKSKSCGCLRLEVRVATGKANRRHGMTGTSTHTVYLSMLQRCGNPRNKQFPSYGGRGITVCSRWLECFENFLDDMGARPEGKSLDRRDNYGGYSPENCRWATPTEQCNNRRNNRRLEHGGVSMTVAEWARYAGLEKATLLRRLKAGWPFDDVIARPVRVWPGDAR